MWPLIWSKDHFIIWNFWKLHLSLLQSIFDTHSISNSSSSLSTWLLSLSDAPLRFQYLMSSWCLLGVPLVWKLKVPPFLSSLSKCRTCNNLNDFHGLFSSNFGGPNLSMCFIDKSAKSICLHDSCSIHVIVRKETFTFTILLNASFPSMSIDEMYLAAGMACFTSIPLAFTWMHYF